MIKLRSTCTTTGDYGRCRRRNVDKNKPKVAVVAVAQASRFIVVYKPPIFLPICFLITKHLVVSSANS